MSTSPRDRNPPNQDEGEGGNLSGRVGESYRRVSAYDGRGQLISSQVIVRESDRGLVFHICLLASRYQMPERDIDAWNELHSLYLQSIEEDSSAAVLPRMKRILEEHGIDWREI